MQTAPVSAASISGGRAGIPFHLMARILRTCGAILVLQLFKYQTVIPSDHLVNIFPIFVLRLYYPQEIEVD